MDKGRQRQLLLQLILLGFHKELQYPQVRHLQQQHLLKVRHLQHQLLLKVAHQLLHQLLFKVPVLKIHHKKLQLHQKVNLKPQLHQQQRLLLLPLQQPQFLMLQLQLLLHLTKLITLKKNQRNLQLNHILRQRLLEVKNITIKKKKKLSMNGTCLIQIIYQERNHISI